MKKTYIAKESRLPARKRSKKLQNTATTAMTAPTTMSVSGETLWHKETDEATQEVSAKADLPAKVMRHLTLVSDDGEAVTLSVSQGRLHVDKSVVSSADMVAYGTEESEVTTVEELIKEVIESMRDAGQISSGAGITSVALDYDNALYKFRVRIIDGNGASYYSKYVDLPIETVRAIANTAKTTADSANSKVDNLQIGGRNLILSSTPLKCVYPTASYNQYWKKVSDLFKLGTPSNDLYVTVSYKVDNWTQSYPPIHTVVLGKSNGTNGNWGTDSWSRRVAFANSSYRQLNSTTRLYSATQIIKVGDSNIGGISNGIGLLTNAQVHPSTAISLTIYDYKLEFGTRPTDYTPAPEDVEEEISRTKAEIINGNVASATKLQTARALWGNSFNGTAGVNGDMVFAPGTNGRVLRILTNGSFRLQAPTSGDWVCGFLGRNAANTENLAGFGVFGTANTINYYYMGIGHGAPCLKVTPAGDMTINGSMVAKGDVTAYSDARVKSDIEELSPRGELRPVSYIKDGRRGIGFIAQEVREVYPELVREDEDGMLSLNYNGLVAVLYAEVQELRQALREIKG